MSEEMKYRKTDMTTIREFKILNYGGEIKIIAIFPDKGHADLDSDIMTMLEWINKSGAKAIEFDKVTSNEYNMKLKYKEDEEV